MAIADRNWTDGAPRETLMARIERMAGAISLLEGWRRFILMLAAGASVSLAHAPYDWPFALFVAFPLLVLVLDGMEPPSRLSASRLFTPAIAGWAFGFGMYGAGMWWLGNALIVSGSGPAWTAPLASLGLAAVLALFPAAAAVVARLFWTQGVARIAVLAVTWAVFEMARAHVATGFPWLAIGYAAMPVPLLMQSVAVVGMDAMNALTVLAAASPVLLLDKRTRPWGLAVPIVLIGAHAAFGAWRLATTDVPASETRVRVVQPAIPQSEKWDGDARVAVFGTLLDLSVAEVPEAGLRGVDTRPADWIVWPETAFPFALSDTPEARGVLADTLKPGQVLLAGGTRAEGIGTDRLWFNSLYAVGSDGTIIGTRDKVHLVPFGEYLPLPGLLNRLGLTRLVEAPEDFTPAVRRETLTLPGGAAILPLICYEAIFPDALNAAGDAPTAIVNITNDAWFGATPGPHQHMRQSRIRAVEAGMPMIRAANDGISAMVDPLGRIIEGIEHGERGAFEAQLPTHLSTPFPTLRAMPWLWLLVGLVAAMTIREAWLERRRFS